MANLVLVHKQEINTGRVFPTRSSRIASFSDKSQFGIFFPESVFQILSFVCRPLCRCHPSAICALGKGADDPEIPTNTICSILNLEKTAVATLNRARGFRLPQQPQYLICYSNLFSVVFVRVCSMSALFFEQLYSFFLFRVFCGFLLYAVNAFESTPAQTALLSLQHLSYFCGPLVSAR